MTIDVVVPSVRGVASVNRLLDSIAASHPRPSTVSVISNSVKRSQFTQQLPLRIIKIASDFYPMGAGDAALRRNVGIYNSPADSVVFLDDDLIVPPDIFSHVRDGLEGADYIWGHHRFIDFTAHTPATIAVMPADMGRSREQGIPAFHGWQSCYAGMFAASRQLLRIMNGFDMQFSMRHASEDQHLGRRLLARYHLDKAWISEPPFAWHPETVEPYDLPPHNLCGDHAFYSINYGGRPFTRCRRCPYLMADKLSLEPELVLPFEPDRVQVEIE